VQLKNAIPRFRIFDENRSKEFYIDFLGFSVDWEHRFEEGLPVYMQISKDDCVLHLTGHHGDCCPGGAVWIETESVEEYCKELNDKKYKHSRPGTIKQEWGTTDMAIKDPFGNLLIFSQRAENGDT